MTSAFSTGTEVEPPRPFRLTSPQTLELREGGRALALFGLPFFLAGLVMTLTLLGFLHVKVNPEPRSQWAFLWLVTMGLVFTGIGAVLTFGRRWTFIDTSRGVLVRSYGLLVPLKTQERPLSEFNAVVVAYNMGDSDSPETYPVRLRAFAGPDFVVRSPQKFAESRVLAEYLSGFLRFPLVDTITDHETVAVPGCVYQPLRERLVVAGAEVAQTQAPANLRSRITQSGDKTVIMIPRGGGPGAYVLGIVVPLFVFLVVFPRALHFLSRPETSPLGNFGWVLLLTVLFVPVFVVLSLKLLVAGSRKATTVVASPAGLEIEQWSGWRKQTKLVAAADLLDVDSSTIDGAIENVLAAANAPAMRAADSAWLQTLKKWVPSRGIVIKSRTELITCGEGLPANELQYLASVLRKALAAR